MTFVRQKTLPEAFVQVMIWPFFVAFKFNVCSHTLMQIVMSGYYAIGKNCV